MWQFVIYFEDDLSFTPGVVMFNHAEAEFTVKAGDRIAQLVCERIAQPEIQELASLDATERGEGGFGSTGTK